MANAPKQARSNKRSRLVIIVVVIIVLVGGGVAAFSAFGPKPDYVKLCLQDQMNGRVTETSAGPNCEKAAEAERLKDCGGTVEACRETLEN